MTDKCPMCGSERLYDVGRFVYRMDGTNKLIYDSKKTGQQCADCGWKSDNLAEVLFDRFVIPCDLCNKYFSGDGACPKEIERCNSEEHWRMLLERISEND